MAASCARRGVAYVVQPQRRGLVRRAVPRAAADRAGRAGDRRTARHDLVSRGCACATCPTIACRSCFSRSSARSCSTPSSTDARRAGAGDPGEAARGRSRTGSGARSRCRARSFTSCTRFGSARDRQDEYFGTLVNAYLASGGARAACAAGKRLCRRGHARWLSRSDPAARGGARHASARARRTAANGSWTMPEPPVSTQVWIATRNPRERAGARAVVSQHRSQRRPDRAGPFPRRLPGHQMAALRRMRSRRSRPARPCSISAATAASTRSR